MKKIIMMAVCATCALTMSAQRASSSSSSFFSTEKSDEPITFGVQAGVNFAGIDAEGSPDGRTAYNFGVTVDLPVIESLHVKSGLFYSEKGWKLTKTETDGRDYESTEEKGEPAYLEIPILASYRYNFSDNLQLQFNVGPYIAYGIAGKYKLKDTYEDRYNVYEESLSFDYFKSGEKDEYEYYGFKKFDLGWQVGVGLTVANHYAVGVAYEKSFSNVSKSDGPSAKNTNFMVNLNYIF